MRTAPLMTAEELLRTSIPNKATELVRGWLVVREPPGGRHGNVTANLAAHLWTMRIGLAQAWCS